MEQAETFWGKQGHLFIAVNCAKFRGTATSQKREFRGHFAAKIDNFAAISRPRNFEFRGHFAGKFNEFRDNFAVEFTIFL